MGDTYYQVHFFSNDADYKDLLPNVSISVPRNADIEFLRSTINKLLAGIVHAGKNWKPVLFDFYYNGNFVYGILEDFMRSHGLVRHVDESIIHLECVYKDFPPRLAFTCELNDWVYGVKSSKDIIAAALASGSVALMSHSGVHLGNARIHLIGGRYCEVTSVDVIRTPYSSGNQIVSCGRDQLVILSQVVALPNNGFELIPSIVFRGHERSVDRVKADKTGLYIVSASCDGALKLWSTNRDNAETNFVKCGNKSKNKMVDVLTKVPLLTLSHVDKVAGLDWTNSQRTSREVVAVTTGGELLIWDLEISRSVFRTNSHRPFLCVASSPFSGNILTGSTGGLIRLYDARSKEGSTVKQRFLLGSEWTNTVSWSPKNENMFISGGSFGVCMMWDLRRPSMPVYEMVVGDRIFCSDWSVDNLLITGGTDARISVFSDNI